MGDKAAKPTGNPRRAHVLRKGWVAICEMTKEFTTWDWLCSGHKVTRQADGWKVTKIGEAQGQCVDCHLGKPLPPAPVQRG